jgi:mRNA-degrading endonuclease RelE of RelBE toxin-antitoxin system
MKFNVFVSDKFKTEAKRLLKKYPSLKEELVNLNTVLSTNPTNGVYLGNNVYKIRLSIKSKGKGKRGGARIITYVLKEKQEVHLLTIYDKSEFSNIDNKALKQIIKSLNLNK